MSRLRSDQFLPTSSLSLEEDLMVRKLLLAHDPDGRHLDSELLLQAIEDAMCCATSLEIAVSYIVSWSLLVFSENIICQNIYVCMLADSYLIEGTKFVTS